MKDLPTPLEKSKAQLNKRQWTVYLAYMAEWFHWMITCGKNPNKKLGLAECTAENYLQRLDRVVRWWWELEGTKTLVLNHAGADNVCRALAEDELTKTNGELYSLASKRKINDTIRKYFEWFSRKRGGDDWSPPHAFNDQNHRPADYLTRDERRRLRDAVLTFDTIPSYSDCTPEQRDELKAYLAQRLGRKKEEITPDVWEEHNTSWEIPSLIFTSLDVGFRPVEVKKAVTSWSRLEKQAIHIPKEQASKGRDNWEGALRPDTTEVLDQWLEERAHLTKYEDCERLWLTREGNPWGSASLGNLLDRLCEEAGIETENRQISFYSIRHSVGQHMTAEGNLAEAKAQLRHQHISSTEIYTDPSVEDRQDSLDRMG